jgi:predicted GIY-YIG superfamily endonuclease
MLRRFLEPIQITRFGWRNFGLRAEPKQNFSSILDEVCKEDFAKAQAESQSCSSKWGYLDRLLYTGHTEDLEKRLTGHNTGAAKGCTDDKRPVILHYAEEFPERVVALSHERQIKEWSRKKKEAFMRGIGRSCPA